MTSPGDDTRARILDVAWEQISEHGAAEITMSRVAGAAGVSRQLLYFHFANRAGLLTAMARRRDETSGFIEEASDSRAMEPVPGLEHLLRAWFAHLPRILPVARALEAAEVTGDDGGAAWRDRMADLREAVRIAIDRVSRDDRLADGWAVDEAADWVWSRIQPGTWQRLVGERDWSPADYAERTLGSLLAELVDEPSR